MPRIFQLQQHEKVEFAETCPQHQSDGPATLPEVRICQNHDWICLVSFPTLSEVRCEICMRRTEIVTLLEARFVFYS